MFGIFSPFGPHPLMQTVVLGFHQAGRLEPLQPVDAADIEKAWRLAPAAEAEQAKHTCSSPTERLQLRATAFRSLDTPMTAVEVARLVKRSDAYVPLPHNLHP